MPSRVDIYFARVCLAQIAARRDKCMGNTHIEPTLPAVRRDESPNAAPFEPNFLVENEVSLRGVTLEEARHVLLARENIEKVVRKSPLTTSFEMHEQIAEDESIASFTFVERVPVLGWFSTDVELNAEQRMSEDGNEIFYESHASAGVWVRKHRVLSATEEEDGEVVVRVRERIEGRCAGALQSVVQREAEAAHQKHMAAYIELFSPPSS